MKSHHVFIIFLFSVVFYSCKDNAPVDDPIFHTIYVKFEAGSVSDIDFVRYYMDLFNTSTQTWEKTFMAEAPFINGECELTVSSEKINKQSFIPALEFSESLISNIFGYNHVNNKNAYIEKLS